MGCVGRTHCPVLPRRQDRTTTDIRIDDLQGNAILRHIESAAQAKGIQRISLETGTPAPFVAAQRLYASEGFGECGPFADYVPDPYSLFMTKALV